MKRILSFALAVVLIATLFCSTVLPVTAAAFTSFETDFSQYTNTNTFKRACDQNGNWLPYGYTFSHTAEGLRYFRDANEVFYNASGQIKTTLYGYKAFGVCETGKTSDIVEVSEYSCYKVEMTYKCDTLGEGASISLSAGFAVAGGNADSATSLNSPQIKMKTEIDGSNNAVINATGSGTITAYFTTSEITVKQSNVYNKLYIILNSTDAKDIDITLTNLKVTALSSITIVDVNSDEQIVYRGQAGSAFTFEETVAEETSLANSKGEYSKSSADIFSDIELKNLATNVTFPASGNATYYKAGENITNENQVAFCGFDDYRLRDKLAKTTNQNIGFQDLSTALAATGTITDEAAYTGAKSLKIISTGSIADTDVCYYIGSGYEMTKGTTYRLTFRYRAVDSQNAGGFTFVFGSGNSFSHIPNVENISKNSLNLTANQLNADTSWKSVTLYYTADLSPRTNLSQYTTEDEHLLLAPVLRVIPENGKSASVYIDSCVISKVVTNRGASVLVDDTAQQAGSQAIRFFFSYDLNGEEIVTDKVSSAIAKRGILYTAAGNLSDAALLNLENAATDENIYNVEKTDLSSCWSYDEVDGKTVFSTYLKDITDDKVDKKLSVRGYVVLQDGTVYYSSVLTESVNTIKEKNENKDMYYEVLATSGKDYRDFDIYVPTTETSGLYYTKYQFRYTKVDQAKNMADSNKSNTAYNQETYRIIRAYLVKQDENDPTSFTNVYNLLQEGELELAIKESGRGDFIGGFHGDEIMNWSKLIIDGEEINLKGNAIGITPCADVVFETDTIMYRCASGTTESPKGTPVANHYLKYDIDGNTGITLTQTLDWLVNDFKHNTPMICMFTVYRYSQNNVVTDTIEYYNWDGSYINTIDARPYGASQAGGNFYSSYNGPAYARAYSKQSGVTGFVGYKNVQGLTNNFQNYVWIRQYGDNKIYFKSNGNTTSKIGEKWEWVNYYNFDYTIPNN